MIATTPQMPSGAIPHTTEIPVRRIGADDLRAALREGYQDFLAKRGDLAIVGLIYPMVGMLVAIAAIGNSVLPLLFPLCAGLSLLGPLVATGFYELARRREAGLESGWWHFFDIRKSPSRDQIMIAGGLLILIWIAWVIAAGLIYAAFMGASEPASISAFLREIFTTARGWAMMIVGDIVGLGFAMLVLATSLTSFPMLIDRPVDAGTAIRTSVRAVRENPAASARWGIIVAGLLLLGAIPFFIGLAVVLPVLGYATWHLYTRLIDRSALPR